MNRYVEELFNDLKIDKDCFDTAESKIISDKSKSKLPELAEKLSAKEREELYSLYKLSKEFTHIYCANHFEKGFQIGFRIAYDISEKLNDILD